MEKADPIARSPLYATCELLGAEYVQEAGWLVVRRSDAVEPVRGADVKNLARLAVTFYSKKAVRKSCQVS